MTRTAGALAALCLAAAGCRGLGAFGSHGGFDLGGGGVPASERLADAEAADVATADLLIQAGDARAALDLLDAVARRAPETAASWPFRRALADARHAAAGPDASASDAIGLVLQARHAADDAESEALLERALEQDPACHRAHHALALAAARRGRFDDAERHLDAALESWPGFAEALEARAATRDRLADFRGAAADYEACLALRPDAVRARYNFASLLHRELGRLADAEEQYRVLLDVAPGMVEAQIGLAAALMERPDRAPADLLAAESLLLQAAERDPIALFDLGLLYDEELRRPHDALAMFERFLAWEGPQAGQRTLADRMLYAPRRIERLRARLNEEANRGGAGR